CLDLHMAPRLHGAGLVSLPSVLPYRFGPPRHRPSFPTRRSSDLPQNGTRICPPCVCPAMTRSAPAEANAANVREYGACVTPGTRSEEHTSELQSRFDLVCRLLLEKKNHKRYMTPEICHSHYRIPY